MRAPPERQSASFRDPSGFLFRADGSLLRQVNHSYRTHYDHMQASGMAQALVEAGLLIPHEEAPLRLAASDEAYRVIKPTLVPFISYPYEWCFSQLKHAALATLEIQERALQFGMTLKDSSAYNIQFLDGRPVLIDSLSFEKYQEGAHWVPYRQFCQHFLGPLALMSYKDIRLGQLLRVHMDGIPLDLASTLLPVGSRLRFSLLSHVHLHAKSQKMFADKPGIKVRRPLSRHSLRALIASLRSAVERLEWQPAGTEWAKYYEATNYSPAALSHKGLIVDAFLQQASPSTVWDLGANTGIFSRLAALRGATTISFDLDPACVETNYRECRSAGRRNLLPLLLDLTNPSSGIGWEGRERMSFEERGPADIVLALALIHHLAISNNLPLGRIADFLSRLCRDLIIEFVPKTDTQVQRLLLSREDIFPGYRQDCFETAFAPYFEIVAAQRVQDSERTIYLLRGRSR